MSDPVPRPATQVTCTDGCCSPIAATERRATLERRVRLLVAPEQR